MTVTASAAGTLTVTGVSDARTGKGRSVMSARSTDRWAVASLAFPARSKTRRYSFLTPGVAVSV